MILNLLKAKPRCTSTTLHGSEMKRLISIIPLACISACTSLPDEPSNQPPINHKQYFDEKTALEKTEYKLGLALSGGGIRSSLYSYGALKALYDAGILQEVDIVSSVSGGGYTAYSLFTNEQNSDFGSYQFSDTNIYKNTCELIVEGNFVTTGQIVKAAISFSPHSEAVKLYQNALGRTFAGEKHADDTFPINELLPEMKEGKLPFWVVNTTVQSPKAKGWRDGLFEYTPLWMGNDAYGYQKWKGDNAIPLRKAIAISGAAFAPLLKQDVYVELPELQSTTEQSDGGHSENLGAIALIKRGVKDIIIIDAEHDPDYEFGAYFNLKKRLAAFNATLHIDEIEKAVASTERLTSSVSIGKVTSNSITSNIYYIKMSMPKSIDKIINDEVSLKNGKMSYDGYFATLKDSIDKNGNWNCDSVKDKKFSLDDFYAYKIASYSEYLNDKNYVRYINKLSGFQNITESFFHSKFPQYSTADQSFYLDQSIAFMGLGYHSTKELTSKISLTK